MAGRIPGVLCPVHGVGAAGAYNKPLRCRCDVCRRVKRERAARWAAAHPEQNAEMRRVISKRWAARNPERRRAVEKASYERHHEKRLLKARRWREANPERARAYNREYRQRPEVKARNREQNKLWRAQNRERARDFNRRRLARKASAPGSHTLEELLRRVAFYGWACYVCRGPYQEIDHVIPLSRGGSEWPANLRPICRSCNARKNDRKPGEWQP